MTQQSQSFRPLPISAAPAHSQHQMLQGMLFGALGAVFFSLKGIFIKIAYGANPELDSATLLTIRMGIALPLYGVILIWAWRAAGEKRKSLTHKHYLLAGGVGLLGYYLAAILDFSGLQYITAQLERLILYTYPMLVMVLGALFFGKRITRIGIIAMVVAYGGIVLIFMRGSIAVGSNVTLGAIFVFGAALSFALFQLLAVERIKMMSSALFTCVAMMAASFGVLCHFIVESFVQDSFARLLQQPAQVWGLGAAIAIISTIIPSFLLNIALGRIGAQKVSIISMISPLVTVVLAINVLHEPFGWVDGIGTFLIVCSIGLYTWTTRKI